MCELPQASWDGAQAASIARYEEALARRMAKKRKRLTHSLGVGATAEGLALLYGADAYAARVAGILHDWDKALSKDEQLAKARELGVDLGVDLELVSPLLHGITAAHTLAEEFPELGEDVLQAIERHTIGAANMTPLDMVVFVADGIEPGRPASEGIERVRSLVGEVPLDDLFWASFAGGVEYVVATERYLYPGTIDIYNQLVLSRRV